MVDMVKKVLKADRKLGFLQPGETVLAASAVGEVGQFQKAIAYGVVARIHAQKYADRAAPPAAGSLAGNWPPLKAAILVVTDQRLLVCSQSLRTFGPKQAEAGWPRDQVRAITLTPGKASMLVDVHFTDGSAVRCESIVTAKPELLAEAVAA